MLHCCKLYDSTPTNHKTVMEPEWGDKTKKEHRLRAASAVPILFALVTAVSKVGKKNKKYTVKPDSGATSSTAVQ